jgi:hypothetical protein
VFSDFPAEEEIAPNKGEDDCTPLRLLQNHNFATLYFCHPAFWLILI